MNEIKVFPTCSDNISNVRTEKLFREAEDCFFFFKSPDAALDKLNEGLGLDPVHVKSLKLRADIKMSKRLFEEAFEDYSKAAALKPEDSNILLSVATCLKFKKEYKTALAFCEEAFRNLKSDVAALGIPLCDMKTSLLIKLKRYEDANCFVNNVKKSSRFNIDPASDFSGGELLKKKMKLREKINRMNLKIV